MWNLQLIKDEIKATSSFGVLAIITTLSDFFMVSTNLAFMGRLNSDLMAAASLALSWSITTFFLVWGLSSTLVTFIAQAKGAYNMKLIGHSLQRALLVMGLATIPVALLWFFTENIFNGVGIEPSIASKAGLYNRIQLPGIAPFCIYIALVKYVQAQGEYKYPALVSVISCLCNVVFNYVFMFGLFGWFGGLGYEGSAVAFALTRYVYLALMLVCIRRLPHHSRVWTGWSLEALQPSLLVDFLKMGIPTALTICLEVWAFDAITLVAGLLKSSAAVSAHAIGFNLVFCAYLCPGGIGDAAATRVGIALGEGNSKVAKQIAMVALGFICTITTTTAILILALHKFIPYIYTSDPAVIEITSNILIFTGFIALVDGIQSSCGAILRGCGRPKPGTICNLIGHYCFGVPIGVSLAFTTKLKVYGLWCGMLVGAITVCISLVVILVRLDWEQVAVEAKLRTKMDGPYELAAVYSEETSSCNTEGHTQPSEPEFVITTEEALPEDEQLLGVDG